MQEFCNIKHTFHMKSFSTLALVAGVASATLMDELNYDFMKYITAFNKRYGTMEEFEYRLSLFKIATHEIKEHNARSNTSTMGHNHFSDWSDEEF